MMSTYRNLRCNLKRPSTLIDHTALGVLDALTANTGRVYVDEVDAAIHARPFGRVAYKAMAVKALRNVGYAITAKPARHLSWYRLNATPDEYEEHRRRVVSETYSRIVTIGRELTAAANAVPNNITLDTSVRYLQMTAISLGTDIAVGMTMQEVINDLQPL